MRKEHWYVDYATFDLDKDINGYKQTRENIEEFMKKNPEMAFTIGEEYANPSLFYKGFGSIEGHYVKHTQAGYDKRFGIRYKR